MRYLGVENQLTQPIWDTCRLAAVAAQTVSFFQVPLYGLLAAGLIKSYALTNLVQAGRLEKGLELTITGISCFVRSLAKAAARPTLVDYVAVFNNSNINLLIGQQSFFRLCLPGIPPAAAEVDYFSNIVAAATEYMPTHGIGTVANVFPLDNPLVLEDQESIRVDLEVGDTIAAVTDVTIMLHGSMTRPVR